MDRTVTSHHQSPEVLFSWTVMAEVANPVDGEPNLWLRNDVKGGDDPQSDAASPVWDLLEAKGYTVLSTVCCPTELACPDCGMDVTATGDIHTACLTLVRCPLCDEYGHHEHYHCRNV